MHSPGEYFNCSKSIIVVITKGKNQNSFRRSLRTGGFGIRQDGDRRLPTKEEQKHLFLDALGVPLNSERRTRNRGIYHRVLN